MKQHLQSVTECDRKCPPAVLGTEKGLRDLERQAWNVYSEIAARMLASPATVEAMDEHLTTRVIPTFSRIGVDGTLVRALFGLASEAWGALDTASAKLLRMHPNMQQDIAEVRQGLLIQADRKMALRSGLVFLTPQESYERLQETMDPANLHLLIDEIVTSWIILPRAYTSLRRDHVHYLPAYLKTIDNEADEEALHIFTRIAIEFLANFTIRFADKRHPPEQVVRLVTAGYTALFWRSLNTPPRGFEDIRIFEHFLTWLKYSGCRAKTPSHDLEATIQDMESRKAVIFPPKTDFTHSKPERADMSRFMVALRHGCKGIDAAVRYFWLPPAGTHWSWGQNARWSIIVFSLKSLFDLITFRYGAESKRTQHYIREFLFQLRNAYAYSVVYSTTLDKQNRADLQCLRSRVMAMIQQLQCALSTLTP